jgi:hypothetical protein
MEIFFQSSRHTELDSCFQAQTGRPWPWALTSGALGVFLDVLALSDELVLSSAGKAALHGSAQLRSKARGGAGDLSGSKHRGRFEFDGDVQVSEMGAECEIRSYSMELG